MAVKRVHARARRSRIAIRRASPNGEVGHAPARACVQSPVLAAPRFTVEIAVVAALG